MVPQNVEYARTLLLNIEHNASTSAASKTKKSALQADLQQKRQLIKQIHQRLDELNQLDDETSEDSAGSEDDDDVDRFPSYAPHIKADAGLDIKTGNEGNEALAAAAQNLTSELRRRGGAGSEGITATGSSLFGERAKATTGDASGTSTEAILSHNRIEQEALTDSLLEMAKQLKQQSVYFHNTLEGDKGILNRTVESLDRSTLGMEAAGQRMGTLRRMTEGRGWWDRIKLYAIIFGLWIVAFLIVFVGPKIRF
jgi:DNA-binding ferritin-like protein